MRHTKTFFEAVVIGCIFCVVIGGAPFFMVGVPTTSGGVMIQSIAIAYAPLVGMSVGIAFYDWLMSLYMDEPPPRGREPLPAVRFLSKFDGV